MFGGEKISYCLVLRTRVVSRRPYAAIVRSGHIAFTRHAATGSAVST